MLCTCFPYLDFRVYIDRHCFLSFFHSFFLWRTTSFCTDTVHLLMEGTPTNRANHRDTAFQLQHASRHYIASRQLLYVIVFSFTCVLSICVPSFCRLLYVFCYVLFISSLSVLFDMLSLEVSGGPVTPSWPMCGCFLRAQSRSDGRCDGTYSPHRGTKLVVLAAWGDPWGFGLHHRRLEFTQSSQHRVHSTHWAQQRSFSTEKQRPRSPSLLWAKSSDGATSGAFSRFEPLSFAY